MLFQFVFNLRLTIQGQAGMSRTRSVALARALLPSFSLLT